MNYNYYLVSHKDGDNNSIKIENRLAVINKTPDYIIAKPKDTTKTLSGVYSIVDNSANKTFRVIVESVKMDNSLFSVKFKIIEESTISEEGKVILRQMFQDF